VFDYFDGVDLFIILGLIEIIMAFFSANHFFCLDEIFAEFGFTIIFILSLFLLYMLYRRFRILCCFNLKIRNTGLFLLRLNL
jgi:uncharacterized membrane protein